VTVTHLIENIRGGGAAVATIRLHQACLANGVDSRIFYRQGPCEAPEGIQWDLSGKLWARLARWRGRHRQRKWHRERAEIPTTFTPAPAEVDPADLLPALLETDLVNIHLTGYSLGTEKLLELLPGDFPVVLTFHDQEGLTGGCHYMGGCRGHLTGCPDCPQVARGQKPEVRKRYAEKARIHERRKDSPTAIVAISTWQQGMIEAAPLAKGTRVVRIHHGLDGGVYNCANREEAKRALGLGDKRVLLFGAAQNNDPRKGAQHLEPILESLETEGLLLTSFGDQPVRVPPGIPYRHLGNLQSEEMRALVYKAADVFLATTMEEAFGLTVLESLACGTPVAGFRVGGLIDMVEDGVNGYLADPGDARKLASAVDRILRDASLGEEWRKSCPDWLCRRFSYTTMGTGYANLYRELLATRSRA
jgi:glycosyltransferase involved in cell wall biosynthesis